ncbi:MAG: hypothetical protein ACO3FE_05630 [Planctomycetaceae bacterium]
MILHQRIASLSLLIAVLTQTQQNRHRGGLFANQIKGAGMLQLNRGMPFLFKPG